MVNFPVVFLAKKLYSTSSLFSQAQVIIERSDNFIHWIGRNTAIQCVKEFPYSLIICVLSLSVCLILIWDCVKNLPEVLFGVSLHRWLTYPLDNVIRPFNNWGRVYNEFTCQLMASWRDCRGFAWKERLGSSCQGESKVTHFRTIDWYTLLASPSLRFGFEWLKSLIV